jgi:hypothetical protein
MSTITCNSCGMEYDGTGLQAGVQFQCTQCGSMVQVGAPGAPRGVKRGPGGPRAAGGVPARRAAGRAAPAAAGGPQQQFQDQQQQQGYPVARSKSNAGLFVGLGVGGVVLVLIIVVVVMSSGTTPEQAAGDKKKAETDQRKKEVAEEDARRLAVKQSYEKTYGAVMEAGPSIEAALRGGNASTIENLFDWQAFALYNDALIQKDPQAYLNSKDAALLCVGDWVKGEDGQPTGVFQGKAPHGPDSLKARVMYYISEFYFGAQDIKWERTRTEAHEGFKQPIGSTEYVGKVIYISFKGGGAEKEFWVAAPLGSADVRIINFRDKGAFPNLQGKEAKKERGDDRRDPYNPERDPRNPDRDPADPEPEPEQPTDPDANLPEAAKTGAMPTVAALLNAIDDLKRGQKLNSARIQQIEKEPSKSEKKATMGALIDLLLDAVKANDRAGKNRISLALYDVWQPFVPQGWGKDDMVYTIDFDGQSTTDLTVRRWLDIYNAYKTD